MATITETEVLPPEIETVSISPIVQQKQRIASLPDASSSARTLEPLEIESTPESEPEYPTGLKRWGTLGCIWIVLILGGLDANIVATAVPSITEHFHTVADVGWYASAFRLCTCSFQFGIAKLYKLFSIKIVFMSSNVVSLIGSLLCATAKSSAMFIVGRAVNGIGFAGELSGCYAVLVNSLPLSKRPASAGVSACVESLAIIAAPLVGGALTQSLGWRWCFWYHSSRHCHYGLVLNICTGLIFPLVPSR